MSLKMENELGQMKVSNTIIAQIIYRGIEALKLEEKLWPATPRGRQIGMVSRFTDNELSMYIDCFFDDKNTIILEFNTIAKFGVSIKKVTKVLSDYIYEAIKENFGNESMEITINIAGVKSKQKAKRNTKVVYRYEAE